MIITNKITDKNNDDNNILLQFVKQQCLIIKHNITTNTNVAKKQCNLFDSLNKIK